MAGLQRSAQTFRRSGSSGLVWDERFLTEDGGPRGSGPPPELRHSRSVGGVGGIGTLRRRGRAGEAGIVDDRKRKLVLTKPKQKDHQRQQQQREEVVVVPGRKAFRTRDVAPAADPPSPRVSGCCAPCAAFRGSCAVGSWSRRARPKQQ